MKAFFTVLVLLLDELILIGLVFFILWKLGIPLPLGVIIALVVLMATSILVLHIRVIVPMLDRKQLSVSEAMIGLQGKVVTPLSPEGVIKVAGELWKALSTDASIGTDEEVIVVGIEGLRLFVRRKDDAEQGGGVRQKGAKVVPGTGGIRHGC